MLFIIVLIVCFAGVFIWSIWIARKIALRLAILCELDMKGYGTVGLTRRLLPKIWKVSEKEVDDQLIFLERKGLVRRAPSMGGHFSTITEAGREAVLNRS